MTDIRVLILTTLAADAAFRTAAGVTAEDPRVYWYYNGDSVVSETFPGYITYALISSGEPTHAVASPTFSFAIWARFDDVVAAIRDRLVALFHKQLLTTSTGRKVYCKVIQETDSFQTQPNYAGMMLHIRYDWLAIP